MKKLFALTIICMILLVGNISAFEFDNKLTYSNQDLKVELTNWFGYGEDYGSAELKSHNSIEEIRQVYIGDPVLTWYDFDFEKIYYNGIGEVIFIDEDTGKEVEKDYSFVYWGNLTKEKSIYECSKVLSVNGTYGNECIETEKETIITNEKGWLPYNSRDIPKGKVIIGVRANIGIDETIDVVWTIGGKKLTKHAVVTSGAVETTDGDHIVLTYLNNGTFNTTSEITNVTVLVIGGGGAGAGVTGADSGGGGAGGLAFAENLTVPISNNFIFVGLGGIGPTGNINGQDGQNSSAFGIFGFGGGGGGWFGQSGLDGGSSGAGAGVGTGGTVLQTNFSNATGFGGKGGDGLGSGAGGGGGAGGDGQDSSGVDGGDGGTGKSFSINGTSFCYAGGGGGGGISASTPGSATCGGGAGGTDANGVNAINGTGGGGGGAGSAGSTKGGNGGNGIVIIRFLSDRINVELISPKNNTNFSTQTNNYVANVLNSSEILIQNVSLYINNIINQTNTSGIEGIYNFSETLIDGDYNWTIKSFGDDDIEYEASNGTLFFTIDSTLPQINITSPIGQIDSHSIGDPLFLNWSISDINLDACWFDYDDTNTTITCLDNTTTFNTIEGQQNLTVYANDTFGNENFSITSWTYAFLETGVDFDFNVSETDNQSFELNVSTDITVLSISAILTYNGTNHSSTASCTSGNCTISNIIDISLVTSGEFENKSFFWSLAIFNGTDSSSIQTSTRIQNVSRIHLESCNATFPTQTLNFTVHDEQTLDRISPFSFDGDFDFWIGGGSVIRNNSIQENATEVELCLSPNVTMMTDAIIDYDSSTLTNYTNRFYYFDDKEIDNSSEDIFMYLLQSSSSTSFILKVQDESLLPVTDAIIEIHRFYPGEGIFRIVQIARTDDNGKSIGFFETETVDYKFIIKKDGETLLETGQQKVVPETSPFTLTFNTGDPLGEPWESQNDISDLNSTLVWDDDSGFVTYIYIDSSGNLTLARLLVIQESLVNSTANSVICNETSSLTSATLSFDVGNSSGFYVASSFIDRGFGEGLDKQFTFQIQTLSGVVGLLGLFYGWFLILIASFMFKFNEIAGIWAVTITVFLINLTGLINFGGVFVTGTIAVALILTWIMER